MLCFMIFNNRLKSTGFTWVVYANDNKTEIYIYIYMAKYRDLTEPNGHTVCQVVLL